MLFRQLGQLQQTRVQLAHHAAQLGAAVARVQGREFDRDAGAFVNAAPGGSLADGLDRLLVGVEITRGVKDLEQIARFIEAAKRGFKPC